MGSLGLRCLWVFLLSVLLVGCYRSSRSKDSEIVDGGTDFGQASDSVHSNVLPDSETGLAVFTSTGGTGDGSDTSALASDTETDVAQGTLLDTASSSGDVSEGETSSESDGLPDSDSVVLLETDSFELDGGVGTDSVTDSITNIESDTSSDTGAADPCLNFICPAHSYCVVSGTSASCSCLDGYALEEDTCVDVDECVLGQHSCADNERCVNLTGSYECVARECEVSERHGLVGYPFDAEMVGDYLFVASGVQGLRVYAYDDEGMLALMAEVATLAPAYQLVVSDGVAYMTSYHGVYMLEIFDVSNPRFPQPLAQMALEDRVYDLAYWDGALVILGDALNIIDVSDPSTPQWVSGLSLYWKTMSLVIQDGFLFGATRAGWSVVDVRNPFSPLLVYEDASHSVNAHLAYPMVAVRGEHLWINHLTSLDGGYGSVLQSWDISDLDAPVLAGELMLSDTAAKISLVEDRAYISLEEEGLQIVDISHPASMSVTGTIDDYRAVETRCTPDVDMCPAWSEGELYLLDTSNPDAPVAGPTVAYPYSPRTLTASGNWAFVAEENFLFLIDVSSPTSPVVIKYFKFEDTVMDIEVANNVLYISVRLHGLWVWDLSNPLYTEPTPAQTDAVSPYDLAVADGFLYALDSNYVTSEGDRRAFHVIDIRTPLQPVQRGALLLTMSTNEILPIGDLVYMPAFYGDYLYAFDVSDKDNPVLGLEHPLPMKTFAGSRLGYDAPYLYVGLVDSVTAIYDISVPDAPMEVGQLMFHGRPRHYIFEGETMYLIDSKKMLLRLDNSDRLAPQYTGVYEVLGEPSTVMPHNGYLYVNSMEGGFQVVDPTSSPKAGIVGEMSAGLYTLAPHVVDNTLYLAQVNGVGLIDSSSVIKRFDISDITSPVETGSHYTENGHVVNIDVLGDYAYAAEYYNPTPSSYNTGRITVLDVRDSNQFTFVERQQYDHAVTQVEMNGPHGAAVTYHYDRENMEYFSTLASFDVSGSEAARVKNEITLDGERHVHMAQNGTTAWVANGPDGLLAYDLTGEDAPTLLATVSLPGGASHVFIDDVNRAFVSNRTATVYVFDVSDPAVPDVMAEIPARGMVVETQVQGELLYAWGFFNGSDSIRVMDITDLTDIQVINTIDESETDFGILSDGKVVGTGSYGVVFYDPFVCYAR